MSPQPAIPRVLVVDDSPDDLQSRRDLTNSDGKIWVDLRHPQDVTKDDLDTASVVLVDLVLDSWPERDKLSTLGLKPSNGLALLSVLQEHAHGSGRRPCAFALHTGKMDRLRHQLADSEHIVARAHNLDWVFRKNDGSAWNQIASLAQAVAGLPSAWSVEDRERNVTSIRTWLGLPSVYWAKRAWRDVEECHPPAHELAVTTHGIALVRWLLHRILPYPCFLIDIHHLAARLRLELKSLRGAMSGGELDEWLKPARYVGHLGAFAGPRWWRSGIEALVFELTAEAPADPTLLERKLKEKSSALRGSPVREPVVVVDGRYVPLDELGDADSAVRIVPDSWPPFADQAWTTPELAHDDDRLRAIVRITDSQRIDEGH